MATIYELVESVYDKLNPSETYPYQTLKDVLDDLNNSATSKIGIFTDGLSGGTPTNTTVADAIIAYHDEIGFLTTAITNMNDAAQLHYDVWWKENPSADNFSSYKITPNVLTGGDKTKEKILTESNLPLPAEQDTFFYKGRQTWADDIGNLSGWVSEINAKETLVDGITNNGTPSQTTVTNINAAKAIITNAKSKVTAIKTQFDDLADEEEKAWDEAIRYNQAYSYVAFLENNADDSAVQDLRSKFSGNLPT